MKELVAGPGTGILERRIEGRKVILDGRQATMGAEMPEQVAECVSNTIYTNPAEMLRTNSDVLPSLSLVRFGKVKPFVDGVFAALEEKISTPGFRLSRADFLTRLETDAIGFSDTPHRSAFQYVRALNLLGKPDKKYDQFTALMIKAITEDDPTFSVPQGFYQWTEELSLAYRQMKACAKDFDDDIITELKTQIQGKLKFRDKYKALLAFYSKMVNRLQKNASCLFPDSVLPDQEYFMKLSRETQSDIEGGLGKALVDAIKKGRLELEPSSDSGLYEYMLWEIVPLVKRNSREFAKFVPGKRYQQSMDNDFISQWAGIRDTFVGHYHHGAQLIGCAAMHSSPIIISPELEAEPITESYLRMVNTLRFLEEFLSKECPEALDMRRLKQDGSRAEKTIGEELPELTDLVDGLFYASQDSIHMPYAEMGLGNVHANVARKWLKSIKDDPDLDRNVAMYVPIIRTTDGQSQISYINPGFKLVELNVGYDKQPVVEFSSQAWQDYRFKPSTYKLPVLVHRELRIPARTIINTTRFRNMLPDTFSEKDLDKIVAKVEAG